VRFVANDDNPGFAAACNQGAAALATPWIALVNPDCIVAADSLARLRAHAEALATPCLLGADLVDAEGVRDSAARRRDPDFLALLRDPRWRAALARDPAQSLQVVPAVSGALMFLPRALYRQLGGLDASYRLHAEDLDLCRRARMHGAIVAVANDVTVLHLRGVSSRRKPWFVEWHKHRGLWRYHRRFEAAQHAAPLNALVWLGVWAHFPLAIARGLWRKWRRA
jgi:GT2 family glycosyltransferase